MVIYFHSLVFNVTSLISFQSDDLADFLNPYFKWNFLGLSSTTMTLASTYLIFAGPFNAFLYDFYLFSYPCFDIHSPTHLHGEYLLEHQWR